MSAKESLARLRFEDPTAAAAVEAALWTQLAREDPRMFAALWRRAHRPSRRPAQVECVVPAVEWLDELPPLEVAAQLPAVNLLPDPPADLPFVPVQPLVFEPSPSLESLLPSESRIYAS
jgi:hypothetical protein